MPDQYEGIRNLSPIAVLAHLGFDGPWKARKGGQEHSGKCPIHGSQKNNTAFSIHEDGRYACFSCGAKGKGCLDLVMAVKGVGFKEAVEFLHAYVGSPTFVAQARKPEIKQIQEPVEQATENPPFASTYEKFQVESAWLTARGFTKDTLDLYKVFEYRNDKRRSQYNGSVMLRISRYSDGECVGYLSRNIGEITPEKPKYRFPANFRKGLELYGAWQIKNDSRQVQPLRLIYLVESPFAVLKFAQLGLPAVSPFGWSVSSEQIDILRSLARGVVFLPDRNKSEEAGQYVAELAHVMWVKAPALPLGCDDPEHLDEKTIRSLTGAS